MNFSIKHLSTVLSLLLLMALRLNAQNDVPFPVPFAMPKSPNAAAIEQYGNIPNNLNTGMPAPVIPLYTVSVDDIEIPIQLNYSSGGLKLNDIPGWVGVGWELHAGGMITHTVKGLPDESENGLMRSFPRQQLKKYFNNEMTFVERYGYTKDVYEGAIDGEFDSYSFNFLGRSGRFYINDSGKCITQPLMDIKIAYTYDSAQHLLEEFVIQDESGNSFYFNQREYSSSNNSDDMLFSNYYNAYVGSAYQLSKIVSKKGRRIDFSYTEAVLHYIDQIQSYKSVQAADPYPSPICRGTSALHQKEMEISMSNKFLQSITWDGGSVNFATDSIRKDTKVLDTANNLPYLNKIVVKNKRGEKVKQVFFKQSYFYGNARLKLNGFSIVDSRDLTDTLNYLFDYYNEAGAFPSLQRSNRAQDLWGFYNTASPNQWMPKVALIPQIYLRSTPGAPANNRNPDDNARYGMLRNIYYPTGGNTLFEYEPNTAYFPNLSAVPISMRDYVEGALVSQIIFDKTVDANSAEMDNAPVEQRVDDTITVTAPCRLIFEVYTMNTDPTSFSVASATIHGLEGYLPVSIETTNNTFPNYSYIATYDIDTATIRTHLLASAIDGYHANARMVIRQIYETGLQHLNVRVGGFRIKKTTDSDGIHSPIVRKYHYPLDTVNVSNNAVLRIEPTMVIATNQAAYLDGTYGCVSCEPVYTVTSFDVKNMEGYHIEYPKVVEFLGEDSSGGRIEHYFTISENIGGTVFPYQTPMSITWQQGREHTSSMYRYDNAWTKADSFMVRSTAQGVEAVEDSAVHYNYSLKVGVQKYDPCLGYPNLFYTETAAANGLSNSFSASLVPNFTQKYNINSKQTKEYLQKPFNTNGDIITNESIQYNNKAKNIPSAFIYTDSKGAIHSRRILYPLDYAPGNPFIDSLVKTNKVHLPVEQYTVVQHGTGQPEYVVDASLMTYSAATRLPEKMFRLALPAPVLLSAFAPSYVNGSGSFVKDERYREDISYNSYDNRGNLLEQQRPGDARLNYIWDYSALYPIAEVKNADSASVAFTSFEADGKGNWIFTDTARYRSDAHTGKSAYTLSSGHNITKTGLPTGKAYIVSYWSKNGEVTVNSASGFSGPTRNGWTYWEHQLPTTTSSVTISGSGKTIDHLELYPADAQMTAYTFDELVGITTETTPNNQTTYYEYDGMSRLSLVRDANRNIIKKHCYNYAGQPVTCEINLNPIWQATDSTRCKRCAIDTAFGTNIIQHLQRDVNPYSGTYNSYRWVDGETTGSCPVASWQNTATPLRCKKNVSNENTTEREREQQDKNPCSSTYNQTRWVLADTNATACPLPQIYAKITFDNVYNDGYSTTASFYIRFFSNSACTTPVSVSNLTVSYKRVRTNCSGGGTATNNYTAVCNGTQGSLGVLILSQDDGIHCWNYSYSVTAGTGYVLCGL